MSYKFPIRKLYFFCIFTFLVDKKLNRWQKIKKWLNNKYRLVILNDSTFGESFSLKLTPTGLLIGIAAITIIMTSLVISLVAFTPLREYIPGYGNVTERKLIVNLSNKADSLESIISARDLYMQTVLNVLNEQHESKTEKPLKDTSGKYKNVNTSAGNADKAFREDYEKNATNTSIGVKNPKLSMLTNLIFFNPVKGIISESYNLKEKHFGVDILAKEDEIVKSTLDGTIIYSGFSAQDGYVVHIQHSNNIISLYKHLGSTFKILGNKIKSGEAIGTVGNTGELSRGAHLHFEIWYNGYAINPQELIAF